VTADAFWPQRAGLHPEGTECNPLPEALNQFRTISAAIRSTGLFPRKQAMIYCTISERIPDQSMNAIRGAAAPGSEE